MPRLSFIMTVRNGEAYVAQAVRSIGRQAEKDWELVIVDDHSTDRTSAIIRELGREDARIRISENPGSGVVQAINHGYRLSAGRHLKFVDSDDLLAGDFSRNLGHILSLGASYHDAFLFEGTSAPYARLRIGKRFEEMDLASSLRRLMVSPPRWSWTFSREVGDRVFPLPHDLPSPHGDIFLALSLKKHADTVHVPLPLYHYREHPGQLYGGLFNFSREAVARRARAMLRIIGFVAASEIVAGMDGADALLDPPRAYYGFLAGEKLRWPELLRARLPLSWKLRIAVVHRTPRLATRISRTRAVRKLRGGAPDADDS